MLTLSQAIQGFILHKQAEGRSPHTIADYRNSLCKFVAIFAPTDPPIVTITADDHRRFFDHLASTPIAPAGVAPRPARVLSPKSRRNVHACLAVFWHWAQTEGYVDHCPLDNLHPPHAADPPIEPLTEAEIKRLLTACETSREWYNKPGVAHKRRHAERDKALVLFLYDTGVRATEAVKLQVGNLDLEEGRALVCGKGGKSRYVRIGKRTRQALWRYLATREVTIPDDRLFVVHRNGLERPMDRRVLSRLIRRLGERAGVADVYPHRLRHTFAVHFLRRGGNIYVLQELLGHTSLEMVRRYLKLAEVDTAEAHRRASPADHL